MVTRKHPVDQGSNEAPGHETCQYSGHNVHPFNAPYIGTTIPPPIPDSGAPLPSEGSPKLGNVLVFDPSMSAGDIQAQVDSVFKTQENNQFGDQRYALLFKPGSYDVNVQVGYYTTVIGLGNTPDAVTVTGGVNALGWLTGGDVTNNFWRGVENLAIIPTVYSNAIWATSQATWLRRVHVRGSLFLFDYITQPGPNFASGGFIADSIIDTAVQSGPQQQYLTRNTDLTSWPDQAVFNLVFVGDNNPPSGTWPGDKITVVETTPVIREKPYLVIDAANNYSVVVPPLRKNSQGTTWNSTSNLVSSTSLPLTEFYVVQETQDSSITINIALQRKMHLLFPPGVYTLSQPIVIRYPNTVVLGLGLATLRPVLGTQAIVVEDVDGVTIAGLIFDAGPANSPSLLQIGGHDVSTKDHSANPTAVFDISFRVGGSAPAQTTSCMVVNSRHVIMDNVWIWRADHGPVPNEGTGWTVNPAINGLVVNSNDVSAYGLFVEHFEGFQTLWNGDGGSVYMYQSECPYDVPGQSEWTQGGENGYPSYKVSNQVKSHIGKGIGVYCNFTLEPVQLDNAIETPAGNGITMNHLITIFLNGVDGSSINHIINGSGAAVTFGSRMSSSAE
jgi:hypothetical protein